MKKIFLLTALLCTQFIHTTKKSYKCLGILPSMYIENSDTVPVLVYVEKNKKTKEISIFVTPFDKRRLDHGPVRLSGDNLTKYLNEIQQKITEFGRKQLQNKEKNL